VDAWKGYGRRPRRSSVLNHLGALEITVTPRRKLTADSAAAYARLGVHRLVPVPPSDGDATSTIVAAAAAVNGL